MVVVSDTTTLSNLLIIGHIDLLRTLYGPITIPVAVSDELLNLTTHKSPVDQFLSQSWVTTQQIQHKEYALLLRQQLDAGEAEVIALAIELGIDLLIVDELKGRTVAKSLGLTVIGTLGILVDAKREAQISQVKPLLSRLTTEAGFWVSESLRSRVLDSVNEL